MKPLMKRRTVYAATAVAMLVLTAGVTVATIVIGGFTSHPGQSGATQPQGSAPGVSFPSEFVTLAGSYSTTSGGCGAQDTSLNSASAADTLTVSGPVALCLNTGGTSGVPAAYNAGDFIQVVEVQFSSSGGTPASTFFSIQIYLENAQDTGTANVGMPTNPVTANVETPSSATWTGSVTATEWLTFDMNSSGTSSLGTVNVLVTDCGSAHC